MKDIYLEITRENSDALFEIPNFITKMEYSKDEKESRQGEEYGKIVSKNFCFRFVPFKRTVVYEKTI